MPLLTISIKEEDLQKKTTILLERPYLFRHLKLLHIYHNIDAINFSNSIDKTQQCQLFVRLGGLVENSSQIINYVGDYDSFVTSNTNQTTNTNEDYQLGNAIATNNAISVASTRVANSERMIADIEVNHLIPIGASRHSSNELISRDLFKDLHTEGLLKFSGELEFELFYMDHLGSIKPISSSTGGAVVGVQSGQHVSYLTLMFEYKE